MSDDPWASIRIVPQSSGLEVDYADNQGTKFDAPLSGDGIEVFRAKLAPRLQSLLKAVKTDPSRRRLPIFIDPPAPSGRFPWLRASARVPGAFRLKPEEIGGATWQAVFANLLKGDVAGDDLEIVRLLGGARSDHGRFTLPLRILSVGRAGRLVKQAVDSRAWLKGVEAEDAGLVVSDRWIRELLTRRLRERETDILVCESRDLSRVAAGLRFTGHSPRLVVALTNAVPSAADATLPVLPAGTSLLMLPVDQGPGAESDALVDLLSDFARDEPLHQLGHTIPGGQERRQRALLASNPGALDALRISDAIAGVTDEAMDLKGSMSFEGADKLIGILRNTGRPPDDLLNALSNRSMSIVLTDTDEKPLWRRGRDRFGSTDFVHTLPTINNIARDSDAFTLLSQLRQQIAEERRIEQQTRVALSEAVTDPALREAVLKQQQRMVDITVQRLTAADGTVKDMDKKHTLALNAAYRIRVLVDGVRSPASVLSGGDPPSVDGLLPPPERGRRHILNVVFYSDDVVLKSAPMQRIELPEIGPSEPAQFDIMPQRIGAVQGRIAIYYDFPPGRSEGGHDNHLIQSFLLHVRVATAEDDAKPGEYGIEAVLEFSLTKRFAELAALKPRLMSLILNDGPGTARHRLMMKRGDDAGAVDFTEAELSASIDDIRKRLEYATHTDPQAGPRFPPDGAGPEHEFDAVMWSLAISGRKLHNKLFTVASRSLQNSIMETIGRHDEVIQAVLLGNYPFPWSLLYDFPLPKEIVGGPPPEVCRGFRRERDGKPYSCGDCLNDCLHPGSAKEKIVCVYGFWGLRHQLEQIRQDSAERDKPSELQPVGDGAVRFMVGLSGGYAAMIPEDFSKRLGAKAKQIDDEEKVLDLLWSATGRPAILLLVGHYETQDLPDQPAGPRLTLSGGRFLQPDDVVEYQKKGLPPWDDPHSVILLAACSGAVVELKDVVNFVSVFTNAGAGAVVGPEVTVYESLARRFGVEMSAKIVNGSSVGAAMLDFRRDLLRQFNPLGLVFTSYGFSDLAPPRPAAAAAAATPTASTTTAVLP